MLNMNARLGGSFLFLSLLPFPLQVYAQKARSGGPDARTVGGDDSVCAIVELNLHRDFIFKCYLHCLIIFWLDFDSLHLQHPIP